MPTHSIRYLRLSVTDQCNMRCIYCAPSGCAACEAASQLSINEIQALARAFAANGVDKVRVTGGEPLLRRDTLDVVRVLTSVPGIARVGLTTNGTLLSHIAADLKRAGLASLNISLDSLQPDSYLRITGTDSLKDVIAGLDRALSLGFSPIKINSVVMRAINDGEIAELADLTKELPVHVRFIELMPLGRLTRQWEDYFVSSTEVLGHLCGLSPVDVPRNSSARLFRVPNAPGCVGVISPMSSCFCADCDRVRVTSRGELKPCLRSSTALSIRRQIHDADFAAVLGQVLGKSRQWKVSPAQASRAAVPAPAMQGIGG